MLQYSLFLHRCTVGTQVVRRRAVNDCRLIWGGAQWKSVQLTSDQPTVLFRGQRLPTSVCGTPAAACDRSQVTESSTLGGKTAPTYLLTAPLFICWFSRSCNCVATAEYKSKLKTRPPTSDTVHSRAGSSRSSSTDRIR